jgi:hypothetical protein
LGASFEASEVVADGVPGAVLLGAVVLGVGAVLLAGGVELAGGVLGAVVVLGGVDLVSAFLEASSLPQLASATATAATNSSEVFIKFLLGEWTDRSRAPECAPGGARIIDAGRR